MAAEELAAASRGDEAVTQAFWRVPARLDAAAGRPTNLSREARITGQRGVDIRDFACTRARPRMPPRPSRRSSLRPRRVDDNGKPTLRIAQRVTTIALADMLILDGQIERGLRAAEIIGTMEA